MTVCLCLQPWYHVRLGPLGTGDLERLLQVDPNCPQVLIDGDLSTTVP
jgi:hypothetical protein